ncbi:hypothetical protein PVIIG_05408 [Plasmodium vivax India VII]|uniref:VIR protein n=1 Tax=Plasmodium vivax India VII TaxID=1077284 RepID=A0A0J9S261_PLAVI|nr:hypothetical protein PVIIG_05408 [Plasmodium vivax India VII]
MNESDIKYLSNNILKASELYKLYFEFNDNYNINQNDLHIQDYSVSILSTEPARDLFKKFVKNVKLLSKKYSNEFNKIYNVENNKKRCIYLKYWLYDQIIKKNFKYIEFYNLIKDSVSKKKLFSSDESFSCEFYEFNLDHIKEIKRLYHFLIIYNIYKNKNVVPSTYCQYLNEMSELYKTKEAKCKSQSNDTYCKEFMRYIKPYFNEHLPLISHDACKKLVTTNSPEGLDEKVEKPELQYIIYLNSDEKKTDVCNSYSDNDMNDLLEACNHIPLSITDCKEKIKELGQNFLKLFCTLPVKSENKNMRDNYIKFLNFWFNRELKEIITDKRHRISVYSHFNSLCSKVDDLKELNDKIKEIDDEQYKKWSILYDLYDNYNKIINYYSKNSEDLQRKSSQYAQKCVDTFKLGIDIYNKKNDDEFNNALKEFSNLYNNFKHEIHEHKRIKLPELQKLIFAMDREATVDKKVASFCQSVKNDNTARSISIKSKYEIVMKNSSAQNIYKKFYEENIEESLCVKYCGALISENTDNNKYARICSQIVTNLKKLPTMTNVGHNQEDRCSNLTYWTYDILMNTFNTNKNDNIDNNIISELNNAIFRVNQELKKDKNCTYYIDGTFSEWTEEKYLHDYFENYSTFIQNISDKAKKEIYCQYIDYISKLYKKYMKLCCTCYSRPEYVCVEHCPKFFKCNKQYFPIDLLHKLKCNDNVSLQKEKEIYESLIIDLDVIRKNQLVAMNFYKILTQDYFYRFVFSTFILLGIFFIFFIFYKFTPNRFMLNKKRSKKKQNNYHNSGGNRKELLEYEQKHTNGNSNKKRLRIAYNST